MLRNTISYGTPYLIVFHNPMHWNTRLGYGQEKKYDTKTWNQEMLTHLQTLKDWSWSDQLWTMVRVDTHPEWHNHLLSCFPWVQRDDKKYGICNVKYLLANICEKLRRANVSVQGVNYIIRGNNTSKEFFVVGIKRFDVALSSFRDWVSWHLDF